MKFAIFFAVVAVTVSLVSDTVGSPTPRDETLVISDGLPVSNVVEKKVNGEPARDQRPNGYFHGHVWCAHEGEEPSEDEICQRHCIPKGYSYGLCIGNKCSCI